MTQYKTLIIDDDVENIHLLNVFLKKKLSMIAVVAEATTVSEGIQKYLEVQPEILLLDVNLGKDTIFSFLESIGEVKAEIIFITSHKHFAVKAVNYNITSYVLKPINIQKLQKAIHKAIFNIEQNKRAVQINLEKRKTTDALAYSSIVAIPGMKGVDLVPIDTIDYLEADGKYSIIHLCNQEKKVSSRNIGEYESILNPKTFYRTHHRYLVNITKIIKINTTGGANCEFANRRTVPIAKRRQDSLYQFLNLK